MLPRVYHFFPPKPSLYMNSVYPLQNHTLQQNRDTITKNPKKTTTISPPMATKLLITLILLSLLSLSASLPSQTMLDAAEILSNSGFISMALTLEFGSQTLIPQSPSLTIFSPSDPAFALSGQPPLSLLQFHFSPQSLSFQTLNSLPSGTKIPTFFSNHSLIVTSSSTNNQISLNNVNIKGTPIYDNGSLVIFGIDNFFDPNFLVPVPIQSHSGNLGCITSVNVEVMMMLITFSSLFLCIF